MKSVENSYNIVIEAAPSVIPFEWYRYHYFYFICIVIINNKTTNRLSQQTWPFMLKQKFNRLKTDMNSQELRNQSKLYSVSVSQIK